MKLELQEGAFFTKEYRNVFLEQGYLNKEIEAKLEAMFQTIFYGTKEERLYHPVGDDMGYIEDTGNHDVRTEGMSYAMMICVQMDKKEEFDRIWKWARTYMYLEKGENEGYFAWSCRTDGKKNAMGAAPDGEEYFAMSLFFASHRWGEGEGIFAYEKEAQQLLHSCIHKGENGTKGRSMWDRKNHLIRFIAECDFTDPSYHLPHFYELFSRWAKEEDRAFFAEAAKASREYLKKACHPDTGLCAEYSDFDGTPRNWEYAPNDRHDWYYSDAYRTIANIGLDYLWFRPNEWEVDIANKLQKFFCEKGSVYGVYEIDGTLVPKKEALHPVAIMATNAQASLAGNCSYAKECVDNFWNLPLRQGDRRYYDNCLYFFAYLALSGNYRIWDITS